MRLIVQFKQVFSDTLAPAVAGEGMSVVGTLSIREFFHKRYGCVPGGTTRSAPTFPAMGPRIGKVNRIPCWSK